jgi:hypothetical protein
MKRTLFLTCIGVLALALNAPAEDNNKPAEARGTKARKSSTVQAGTPGHNRAAVTNSARVNTRQNVSAERFNHRSTNVGARTNSNAVVRENNLRANRVNRSQELRPQSANQRVRNNVAVNRAQGINRQQNIARGTNANRFNRTQNVTLNRQRNVSVVNNWRGQRFSGQNYAAFRNYHREWHDRGWWTNHYPRITFYFGAPYYWNSGYWYPAWGYYPGYSYEYDGPIYGYNGLAPDQVTVNVQVQLQRDGYYSGPVDGILGPQTREAIAAFQADHGLAITSAIDEPTLATLGLV